MIDHLPHLQQLLKQLQQMPYVASKNLYRVAHHFLEMDAHRMRQLCTILMDVKEHLVKCSTCWVWQERNQDCTFCSTKRDQTIICVVETWHDLCAIEKTGGYRGAYHVLGGAICPLDGIGPENLTINQLVARVTTTPCNELILAMNQTPEGESTASFIARKLPDKNIKITCLARGIPVGSTLEYMDRLTLHKALFERRLF